MNHLRYILAIPFFLALPLGTVQAQQSPSWTPPVDQPSGYDSQYQNVLEIAPAQQAVIAEPQQSYDIDSSLQASIANDPWYRHQAGNFEDPYYQRRRAREQEVRQEVRVTQQETYRPSQQELTYADQYNEYDPYDQTPVRSTTQPVQTYPSTVSQAPSALWDIARIATLVAGAQSGLVRYDSCRRQYYFASVPIR